jgi:site-specific DNA-methyltransferase (adenine-specific)
MIKKEILIMPSPAYFSSKSNEWATPQDFFDKLNEEFHFTLDVAASESNHKCLKYFTQAEDGLKQDWSGERVWCNPPYGRGIAKWIEKCATVGAELVVLLIYSRTDTRWFHSFILGKAEIRFIKGRLKFGGSKTAAPFPSILCIWRKQI